MEADHRKLPSKVLEIYHIRLLQAFCGIIIWYLNELPIYFRFDELTKYVFMVTFRQDTFTILHEVGCEYRRTSELCPNLEAKAAWSVIHGPH